MRLRLRQGLPIGQGPKRGFTLLELLTVVTIIAVFAALAIPTAVVQLRDRRVQEAARRIGIVYREARLRALGRGSAVLVRFNSGVMTVHEARVGAPVDGNAGCADLPVSTCLNNDWGSASTTQRVIDGYRPPTSGELSDLTVAITDKDDAAVPTLDICFTPMGRAFARRDTTNPLAPLSEVFVATVSRPGMTRTRQVVLMPNGTARLFTE